MKTKKKPRQRLDQLLINRGLVKDRDEALRLIMAGQVVIDGIPIPKAGTLISSDLAIRIKGERHEWVSRGALKLQHAISHWEIDLKEKNCIDVGASTGGFTEVLLTNGAKKVYAVDVGYGDLAWKLRQDKRVVVLERTNIRLLPAATISEQINFLTMDVSFIASTKALPPAAKFLEVGGYGVVLVKPQFELPKKLVGKGGVVTDPELHDQAIARVTAGVAENNLHTIGVVPSPITGPAGNREFLLYFEKTGES